MELLKNKMNYFQKIFILTYSENLSHLELNLGHIPYKMYFYIYLMKILHKIDEQL